MSDDSSSSEDEITKRILKDSIDTDLMTNDLYNGKRPEEKIKKTSSVQAKPSLRYITEDDGPDHNFIKVTPEFQEYVAKNLFKHLESEIIEKKSKHKKSSNDTSDDKFSRGIHLFNGSTKLFNFVSNEPTISIKRKRPNKYTSDKLILQRASETAVSPEWILKKDAIKGWEKMTKGKIMKVKSNNEGTFDIVCDEV